MPSDLDQGLPPALADSTAYLLARALRVSARLAHDEFGQEPLRFAHYVTLCWAEHLGPCSGPGRSGPSAVPCAPRFGRQGRGPGPGAPSAGSNYGYVFAESDVQLSRDETEKAVCQCTADQKSE